MFDVYGCSYQTHKFHAFVKSINCGITYVSIRILVVCVLSVTEVVEDNHHCYCFVKEVVEVK